ncbi:hypothetical protein [Streptomyces sp. NBC_00690]|uniref:hypothetical protein n=1 Tax=Streptomyces sp. NBC_00690 TaxID=2975808 RepID=UPI002E2B0062|nr:hypothetical protein [Streptomyces sp. NBC_00690]
MLAFDGDPAQEQTRDGRPCDELAYGWAAHRRDRRMWEAFQPLEECLDVLLATANAQLDMLPAASQPEWRSKIEALVHAAETIDAEHKQTVARLHTLLSVPDPTVDSVDAVVTAFFDEAWPALDVWANGADALAGLDTAVRAQQGSAQCRTDTSPALRGPAARVAGPHRTRR